MDLDKQYFVLLVSIFKDKISISTEDFLAGLREKEIRYQNDNNLVNEKFYSHFEFLLGENILINQDMKSCGLYLGKNSHFLYSNQRIKVNPLYWDSMEGINHSIFVLLTYSS